MTTILNQTYSLTSDDCYDGFGEPLRDDLEDIICDKKVKIEVNCYENGNSIFTGKYTLTSDDGYDGFGEPLRDDLEDIICNQNVTINVLCHEIS
jgi:hypothetical protein